MSSLKSYQCIINILIYYIFFLYLCTCVLKIICSTLLDVYVPFFKLMNWAVVTLKYCIEVFELWVEGISFMSFSLCVSVSGELEKLQAECCSLQNECDSLRAEKTTLMQKLHRLEEELDRWVTFTQTGSQWSLDHFTQQKWVCFYIMSESTPALLNEEWLNHHIAQQLHLFVFTKDCLFDDAFSNNRLPL